MLLDNEYRFPDAVCVFQAGEALSQPSYPLVASLNSRSVMDWSSCIVQIARNRDRVQFEALFAHFAPRLKYFFTRLGMEPAAAEDLAQDTMLAVWRKADRFDPARAAASTWIFTIARNLRVDNLRRERDPGRLAEFFEAVPEPLPSDSVMTAERDERIRAALLSLTPDQAEAVRFAFFEDCSHSEIAQVLKIPLGTVKSRLREAVNRLRVCIEKL